MIVIVANFCILHHIFQLVSNHDGINVVFSYKEGPQSLLIKINEPVYEATVDPTC